MIFLFSLASCGIRNTEKEIAMVWFAKKANYKGKDLLGDNLATFGNLVEFKENYQFKPILQKGQSLDNGTWLIERKGGDYYVVIAECKDSIFNGRYRLRLFDEYRNNARIKMLELKSEDVYILATD